MGGLAGLERSEWFDGWWNEPGGLTGGIVMFWRGRALLSGAEKAGGAECSGHEPWVVWLWGSGQPVSGRLVSGQLMAGPEQSPQKGAVI